jgi:hypothetical protein
MHRQRKRSDVLLSRVCEAEIVTYVLGTICHPCIRAGHKVRGAARGIRTPDPVITNDVLYQLSYCGGTRTRSDRYGDRDHRDRSRNEIQTNFECWSTSGSKPDADLPKTRSERRTCTGRRADWQAGAGQGGWSGTRYRPAPYVTPQVGQPLPRRHSGTAQSAGPGILSGEFLELQTYWPEIPGSRAQPAPRNDVVWQRRA